MERKSIISEILLLKLSTCICNTQPTTTNGTVTVLSPVNKTHKLSKCINAPSLKLQATKTPFQNYSNGPFIDHH